MIILQENILAFICFAETKLTVSGSHSLLVVKLISYCIRTKSDIQKLASLIDLLQDSEEQALVLNYGVCGVFCSYAQSIYILS